MRIAIPDDYQDAVRTLDCFQKFNGQHVVILREHLSDPEVLAARLQAVEALVLIRERTPITEALLARLPDLRLIVQTGKRAPHLDLAACISHGVAVIYATPPDTGGPYATAELTWGLILAAMRFLPQEVASMRKVGACAFCIIWEQDIPARTTVNLRQQPEQVCPHWLALKAVTHA